MAVLGDDEAGLLMGLLSVAAMVVEKVVLVCVGECEGVVAKGMNIVAVVVAVAVADMAQARGLGAMCVQPWAESPLHA
jgi:phosphatidylserine decarboxylase